MASEPPGDQPNSSGHSGQEFSGKQTAGDRLQRDAREWGLTDAGPVIMITPVIILFLALQRRFIEGLTQGGLKA